MRMLGERLAEKRFSGADVVAKLLDIKETLRGGWQRRAIQVERLESVAEHIYGAWLLALLLLPDNPPIGWSPYDRSRVLHLILIHDLPEAITGDVPSMNQDGAFKRQELEVVQQLDAAQTYPGIFGLSTFAADWQEVEAGATDHGRIVKDFDRLENLLQLHRYSAVAHISDFSEWRRELIEFVRTKGGRQALTTVGPLIGL